MTELNDSNNASLKTAEITARCLTEFSGYLIGAEFGVAYGGGIERIGKLWKERGTVYGFDTYEGHPEHIGEICPDSKKQGGRNSFAARCMDGWYNDPNLGKERITEEYIRARLDEQGLNNVHLVKGIVNDKTDIEFIPYLNYVLIDFDFPLSNRQAYDLVKNKIVKGGYLCLHDVLPKNHIVGNYEFYQDVLKEGWQLEYEGYSEHLAILKK